MIVIHNYYFELKTLSIDIGRGMMGEGMVCERKKLKKHAIANDAMARRSALWFRGRVNKVSGMKFAAGRRSFVLAAIWCSFQIVQAFPPGITKVQVEKGNIHLEFDEPVGEGCVLEIAESPGGTWSDFFPPELNSLVTVPLEEGSRYFRLRCGDAFSVNVAGYLTVSVPAGFSMVANPFEQGENSISELLPRVHAGTAIYKFDNSLKTYDYSDFHFGSWRNRGIRLASGDGAYLFSPDAQELVFSGLVTREGGTVVEIEGGWNMISLPIPGSSRLPEPLPGDAIYRFNPATGSFQIHDLTFDPPPAITPGESFWYFRNEPGPESPKGGTVVLNNLQVQDGVDALNFAGTCPITDPNWVVQLMAGPDSMSLAPIGSPLPISAENSRGYFDLNPGPVRHIASVEPGSPAFVSLRMWAGRTGSSWEEAVLKLSSPVMTVVAGGAGGPPSVPAGLKGLQATGLLIELPRIESQPKPQFAASSGPAKLSVIVTTVTPLQFQWQKQTGSGDWVDVPGASESELVIDPVTSESVGTYRVLVESECGSLASAPADLTLLDAAPEFTLVRVADGILRLEFEGSAREGCVLEVAASIAGPWSDLPVPELKSPLAVPLENGGRYFRFRCGGRFSSTVAGYLRVLAPVGYSMVANPFDQGENTVAEVLPRALPGTGVFRFDNALKTYDYAGFDFGRWRNDRVKLNPGEGVYLDSPKDQELVFSGFAPKQAGRAELEGGWNMMSLPFPEIPNFPEPLMGDAIYQFDLREKSFRITDPVMDSRPAIQPGESFWYFRNEPGPEPPSGGTVLLHNYVSGINQPILVGENCGVSDPHWLVQLFAAPSAEGLVPVGEPLQFLPGEGAGYIDVSPGAVRHIPEVEPGKSALIQLRAWDSRTGANWQEASIQLSSATLELTSGGSGSPPTPPSALVGGHFGWLYFWPGFSIQSQPVSRAVSAGEAVRFEVEIYAATGLDLQWQRRAPSGDWVNIPGANSRVLVIDPVSAESAGSYRLYYGNGCGSTTSQVADLILIDEPRVFVRGIDPVTGRFKLLLSGPLNRTYVVEASGDLVEWRPFFTSIGLEGQIEITDRQSDSHKMRFYRAKMVSP